MQALFEQGVDCPYCGAHFTTLVDTSAGACDYIEDCAVCCQPIEFHLRVDGGDALLTLQRGDETY